jgi:hypothetical protein
MLYTYALLTSPFRIWSQTKNHLHHLVTSTTNEFEAELGYSAPDIVSIPDIASIPDMPVYTSALRPAHPQSGLPWLSTDPSWPKLPTYVGIPDGYYGGHKLYNNKCIPDNDNKFALETFMNNTTDKRRSKMWPPAVGIAGSYTRGYIWFENRIKLNSIKKW